MTAEPKRKTPHINARVATFLADQIWQGTSPYQRDDVQSVPYNPTNGRIFNGMNALHLMAKGRRDDRWYTFDEASAQGYQVRAKSKGTPVINWLPKQPGETTRQYTIEYYYNAEQLRNVPPQTRKPPQRDPLERVTEILENSGAKILYDAKDKSFYAPGADTIHLPKVEDAQSVEKYCAEALRCYFQSTGHPNRLSRATFASVSKDMRSQEDFICETATVLMCAEIGIPHDPTKNAGQHRNWAARMDHHPYDFSHDVSAANEAVYHTKQLELQREKEVNPLAEDVSRPQSEASPLRAVSSYFNRKNAEQLQTTDPQKVFPFVHQDTDIITVPDKGKIVERTQLEGEQTRLKIFTEGYDQSGNTYGVVFAYTAEKMENGLMRPVTEYEVDAVYDRNQTRVLPPDWNGDLQIAPQRVDEDGFIIEADSRDGAEFYRVFAITADNTAAYVADYDHLYEAERYVSLLKSEYERQAKEYGLELGEATQENVLEQDASPAQPPLDPELPKGYELTDERKEELVQTAKQHVEKRDAEISQDTDAAIKRLKRMMSRFEQPERPTPYLAEKNVPLQPGILQNKGSTCVPLHDINKELRSMAYINKDATVRMAKGTDPSNAFYTVGAEKFQDAPVVILTKDLAPAISINEAANVPTIAVFKEENLQTIIDDIKERHPDKEIFIAGSNQMDKYTVVNAMEATEAKLIMPRFASGEQDNRRFNDFNDLAESSKLGKEGVVKQIDTALRNRDKDREESREVRQEKTRGAKEMSRA